MPCILCTLNHEVLWKIFISVPDQIFFFVKRHCTVVNLVEKSLRRLQPAILQGWPPKFAKHVVDTTGVSSSPEGPSGCFLHSFCLSCIIRMSNRSCLIKLETNQCLVCSCLSMPRCHCQIRPKKAQTIFLCQRRFVAEKYV